MQAPGHDSLFCLSCLSEVDELHASDYQGTYVFVSLWLVPQPSEGPIAFAASTTMADSSVETFWLKRLITARRIWNSQCGAWAAL